MSAMTEILQKRRTRSGAFVRLTGFMDTVYLWAGYLGAAFMVVVFAITMAQIICRWFGISLNGAMAYAGYFMAASTFLAFAHTFNKGAHIRIEMFLSMLGRWRKPGEWIAFAVSSAIACWFAWYAWDMVFWSYSLGDLSQELDATPLWIPQSSMAFGLTLFALSIIDHGLRFILTGDHGLPEGGDAL
jgi:TRAP-type C4-dicarboxylate transport system permease small subunit